MSLHLDTNAYAAFFRGDAEAVFILERAPGISLSPVAIGEIKCGIALGADPRKNTERLQDFSASPRVAVAPLDDEVTSRYAAIFKQLRRDGRPIPTNDIWIAAALLPGGVDALFTRDAHFNAVDGLTAIHGKEDFLKWIARVEPSPE